MGKPRDNSMPFASRPGQGIRVAVGLPAFGIPSFHGSRRAAPGEVSDFTHASQHCSSCSTSRPQEAGLWESSALSSSEWDMEWPPCPWYVGGL